MTPDWVKEFHDKTGVGVAMVGPVFDFSGLTTEELHEIWQKAQDDYRAWQEKTRAPYIGDVVHYSAEEYAAIFESPEVRRIAGLIKEGLERASSGTKQS